MSLLHYSKSQHLNGQKTPTIKVKHLIRWAEVTCAFFATTVEMEVAILF